MVTELARYMARRACLTGLVRYSSLSSWRRVQKKAAVCSINMVPDIDAFVFPPRIQHLGDLVNRIHFPELGSTNNRNNHHYGSAFIACPTYTTVEVGHIHSAQLIGFDFGKGLGSQPEYVDRLVPGIMLVARHQDHRTTIRPAEYLADGVGGRKGLVQRSKVPSSRQDLISGSAISWSYVAQPIPAASTHGYRYIVVAFVHSHLLQIQFRIRALARSAPSILATVPPEVK